MNVLDRLFHKDVMSVDDKYVLPTIHEKIESLVIQQKRQTYIGDLFTKIKAIT